ncbi:hypothetical protein [Granulosicoccus antarcticus]|uniref:Uncharacterized protein n=1 Tax=Granulosicoccus antarcticus IMCC3135 TaxID=1192854 RepID=A0A2Z2NR50_9GAMM|nr:hypothetical protein [Granulosicoccus antarcticus]ASJ73709.1 hypothetical protein IMCC3135_18150 [Granulosicoccus antarcticus IMCC3135]
MLLTIQHHQPIKSPGKLLTLALSTASLGIAAMSPVLADSHATTQSTPSALDYESALTGYKSLDGDERTDWKQSNDTVGKIGGWRSYANEAYQANQADAKAQSDAKLLVEGSSKLQEPAAAPTPDTDSKHMDTTSVASSNTKMTPMQDDSQTQLDVQSNTSPLTMNYQSAMTSYRLYDDNPPGDWKAANDRVREIGGWRAYAQEAYEASKRDAQAQAEFESGAGTGDSQ